MPLRKVIVIAAVSASSAVGVQLRNEGFESAML